LVYEQPAALDECAGLQIKTIHPGPHRMARLIFSWVSLSMLLLCPEESIYNEAPGNRRLQRCEE